MVMQGYQLVIDCHCNDGTIKRLFLDTCTEKRITVSAQLASQPVQDGRVISDHMYSNPDEYTISGTFSLYGNIRYEYDDFPEVGASTDRLTNIQNVFEYIKDNALLCDLTTLSLDIDGSERFKIRKGMALKNITWVEKQASMLYNLTFGEIMTVTIGEEYISPDEDLPITIMPVARSLGAILTEEDKEGTDYISEILVETLYERGYITKKDGRWFVEMLSSFGKIGVGQYILCKVIGCVVGSILVSLGIIAAVAFMNIVLHTSIAISSCFPVGTVIGAVAGAIMGIVFFIKKLKEYKKEKKILHLVNNIDPYVITLADGNVELDVEGAKKNTSVNNEDLMKLMRVIAEVKTQVLKLNDDCKIYQISSSEDDNTDREVIINIAGKSYFITFTKNNNSDFGWNFDVCAMNDSYEAVPLIGSNGMLLDRNKVISRLEEADINTNCLFVDSTFEYYVFIYNPSLNEEQNPSQEEQDVVKTKLFSFQVLVTKGPIKNHLESIKDAIYNTIENIGYI